MKDRNHRKHRFQPIALTNRGQPCNNQQYSCLHPTSLDQWVQFIAIWIVSLMYLLKHCFMWHRYNSLWVRVLLTFLFVLSKVVHPSVTPTGARTNNNPRLPPPPPGTWWWFLIDLLSYDTSNIKAPLHAECRGRGGLLPEFYRQYPEREHSRVVGIQSNDMIDVSWKKLRAK